MIRFIKKIRDSYKSSVEHFLKRSSNEKWSILAQITIFSGRIIGIPLMDKNYKVKLYSWLIVFVTTNHLASAFYTMWYYADEPFRALQSTVLFGLVVPAFAIFPIALIQENTRRLQHILWFEGDYVHRESTDMSIVYKQILDECAMKLLYETAKAFTITLIAATFFCCFPIYSFVIKDDLQLPAPVLVPFTTTATVLGVIINILSQVLVSVVGFIGLILLECCTCIAKNTCTTLSSIVCYSCDQTFQFLNDDSEFEMRLQLRNTLIQMQDFDSYVLEANDLCYFLYFLQPYMLQYSISASIFYYLFFGWTSGIGLAVLCFTRLFIICDAGNTVDSAKEKMLYKLSQSPWYLLQPREQKLILLATDHIQNIPSLPLGPFSVLNYETFLNMTKGTYRLLMMLINFMK